MRVDENNLPSVKSMLEIFIYTIRNNEELNEVAESEEMDNMLKGVNSNNDKILANISKKLLEIAEDIEYAFDEDEKGDFINGVIEIATYLSGKVLLEACYIQQDNEKEGKGEI